MESPLWNSLSSCSQPPVGFLRKVPVVLQSLLGPLAPARCLDFGNILYRIHDSQISTENNSVLACNFIAECGRIRTRIVSGPPAASRK